MKILWVTNDLPPRHGGIERFVSGLLERVHPEGSVVVGPASDARTVEHDARQRYRVVRARGQIQPTPGVRRLVARIGREHRPDVVVLGACWPLGELAGGVRRELGVPVVSLSHGLEAGLVQARLGRLVRRASRDLAAVTTISGWTEERLRPHVGAARLARVPPGVDLERYSPEPDGDQPLRRRWGVPEGAPLVGCVSRLVRRKGQDRLLDAWPRVRELHPDAWLLVAGDGPLDDRLRRRVRSMGPGAQVVLPGPIRPGDLPACYRTLDLFAMPCRTRLGGTDVEGLGIVYLEASACGVPSLVGASGGAPETVSDGITGSVVDGEDPVSIADGVDRWLADPAARRTAGKAARERVEERWSWDRVTSDFAALLDDVVGG